MKKIKKLYLILFISLINLFIITLKHNFPISISLDTPAFFQIPIYFWLILILSPILLFLITKLSKNYIILIICAMSYYVIFYSYGFYFISHPTFSDIVGSTMFQEFLTSVTHIGASEISIMEYLRFPIHFIFSKIFSTILGIGPILTLNLAFISLISLIPVFLALLYKNKKNIGNTGKYFIAPILFLTLSYFFLNDQFVPQFSAFIFLILTFGFFSLYQENKNRSFFIFMVIFYILTVFSHMFIYLFFIIAIIVEKIWAEYIEKNIASVVSYEMIIIFLTIPFVYISFYLDELRTVSFGESSAIFDYISPRASPAVGGFEVHPLYNLVPEFYDVLFTLASKGIVAGAFIIVSIGFIFYFLEKREILDIGILVGTFAWFIMGFFNMVLGQRAVQVAPLALSSHYKYPRKIFSVLPKIILILILIAPFFSIANTVINESIAGEGQVQDYEENVAGKFFDRHCYKETNIVLTQNAYPTGINPNGSKYGLSRFGYQLINSSILGNHLIDFVLVSPRSKLFCMYHNVQLDGIDLDSLIYQNRKIDIMKLQ